MRSRPLGPGLGGLYYSALLRDSNGNRTATVARKQAAAQLRSDWLCDIYHAVAGAFHRAGQRLVEARMAEARQHLNIELRRYHLDETSAGRASPVKYY